MAETRLDTAESVNIVQLTDTHLAADMGVPASLRWLLDEVVDDVADLVALTGDIVYEDPDNAGDRDFARDVFIAAGVDIPSGGMFTGAEGVKTAEQVEAFGGLAGVSYDPCYHQACDTIANLSDTALDQMSDASAHATLTFAQTTSAIEGATASGR